MRLPLLFAFIALLLPASAAFSQWLPGQTSSNVRESLDIGTSTSEIAITSDFRGADLTVFGAVSNTDELLLAIGQYDVVVVLEGPRENVTVRKKERILGIWINTRSMTFSKVPQSYSMSSSGSVDDITTPLDVTRQGIGIEHIPLSPIGLADTRENPNDFREAFRRLQLAGSLYERDFAGVRFISSNLFRASIRLPANIPNGVHTVRAYLFKSGRFVTQKSTPLRVIKTGVEQAVTDAAHQYPIAYGGFAVLLALMTGWGASVLFRKD
ncbi:TIGR02186 family protein [Oryzifoliimicrobium ureilyticus]|uniref:TIGR02186 family protein n=1 Tax=Oryzifoliimicrobium ureilyticus TaxID=3113724 RepID=UPI003075F890